MHALKKSQSERSEESQIKILRVFHTLKMTGRVIFQRSQIGVFMHIVEFEASIENGIVHIPKKYQELYKTKKAKFIVIYDKDLEKEKDAFATLQEFKKIREKSNNKIKATLEIATNINELVNDDIF